MTPRAVILVLLGLVGVLSVAVFVGAVDLGTPAALETAPLGALFRAVLYPILGALGLVLLVGLVLVLRRRRAPGGQRRLEMIWTAIPVAALLLVALGERELRAGFGAPPVEITAGLDGWSGVELEAVSGETLLVRLRSSDVAHVLAVPALGLEFPIEPGASAGADLGVAGAGEYELTCSEHARRVGTLRVRPRP